MMLTNQGHRSRERFLRVRADLNRAVAALRCSRSVDAGRDLPVAKIGVLTGRKAHGELPNGRSARFVVVTSDGAHACNLPSLQLQSRHCGTGFDSMRRRLQERWGLSGDAFLGPIEAVKFLPENASRYAFVGGVGQMPLKTGLVLQRRRIAPGLKHRERIGHFGRLRKRMSPYFSVPDPHGKNPVLLAKNGVFE